MSKIVEWNYSIVDAWDGVVIRSGIVKTTETGTRHQAMGKIRFRHGGKDRIQIGWKIKLARKPVWKGETL